MTLIGSVILPGRGSRLPSIEKEYELGKLYLNDLLFLSGGRSVLAEGIATQLAVSAQNLPSEIGKQYLLKFAPGEQPGIERRRQLIVRVDRPGLQVITRGSYLTRNN